MVRAIPLFIKIKSGVNPWVVSSPAFFLKSGVTWGAKEEMIQFISLFSLLCSTYIFYFQNVQVTIILVIQMILSDAYLSITTLRKILLQASIVPGKLSLSTRFLKRDLLQ